MEREATELEGTELVTTPEQHAGRLLVGTCNWSDHEDFYPPGTKPTDRLVYYARHFRVVEIDSTFYAIQPARNFERWARVTPDDFVFNVKAYRELTGHDREKEPEAKTFEVFHQAIQPLRDAGKLRAVHFQFPPWFVESERNREYILTARALFPEDTFAVEFRHRSWFAPEHRAETLDFLRRNGLVHVMVDAPQVGSGTVPKVVAVTSPELSIIRFHGRNTATWYKKADTTGQRFDYLYTRAELAEWLPAAREAASQAREVHVLMNNNRANYAVRNARDFADLLGQQPPIAEGAAEDAQPGLGL